MFDSSSFRVRYKAPVEERWLIALGPALIALLLAVTAWSRFVAPLPMSGYLSPAFLNLLFPISLLALLAVLVELGFGADEGYPWRRSLAASGAGVLGGTLLVGAWGKMLDPLAFQGTIESEGLATFLPASVVALTALGLELGLGSALLLGVRRIWCLILTGALVVFFLFLTGRAYWSYLSGVEDVDASCGCFGNLLDRTPDQAFWQDFMLLVPGLLLAMLAVVVRQSMVLRLVFVAVLTTAGVTLAFFAPDLPLDGLATRLRPGVEIETLCSGSGAERLCLPTLIPELAEGRHLVVIADLDDAAFGAEVENLNDYHLEGAGPRLWVLSAATPEQSQSFFWRHGPSFEIREAPPGLLRPLYRSLPRSFIVAMGKVEQTFNGVPPGILSGAADAEPSAP